MSNLLHRYISIRDILQFCVKGKNGPGLLLYKERCKSLVENLLITFFFEANRLQELNF